MFNRDRRPRESRHDLWEYASAVYTDKGKETNLVVSNFGRPLLHTRTEGEKAGKGPAPINVEQAVTQLGFEGWELVSVFSETTPEGYYRQHFYFKRRILPGDPRVYTS